MQPSIGLHEFLALALTIRHGFSQASSKAKRRRTPKCGADYMEVCTGDRRMTFSISFWVDIADEVLTLMTG